MNPLIQVCSHGPRQEAHGGAKVRTVYIVRLLLQFHGILSSSLQYAILKQARFLPGTHMITSRTTTTAPASCTPTSTIPAAASTSWKTASPRGPIPSARRPTVTVWAPWRTSSISSPAGTSTMSGSWRRIRKFSSQPTGTVFDLSEASKRVDEWFSFQVSAGDVRRVLERCKGAGGDRCLCQLYGVVNGCGERVQHNG